MYYDALGVAKNFRKFFTFKIFAFEKTGKLQITSKFGMLRFKNEFRLCLYVTHN